ncbi:MAG TPA: alpha/beta fold hydrolase [Casimicrobiaceae bacterium]|nr:alpha/beta fold hydrolase [Casimicrobiaceae bacterium]
MNIRTLERFTIDGPAGALEIALNTPETPIRGVALIAHPNPVEGGTLDNKVVHTLAKTFFALSYAAVRFNYRGVGKSQGTFDHGPGETEDALAALAHARTRFGDVPLVLAGFSFGGYIVSRVAKRVAPERIVLVGPAVGRFAVDSVPADTIVIHGEQDDVVALADVFEWARPQELPVTVFPGCGHFFHGRLPQLARVITGMWRSEVRSQETEVRKGEQ